MNRPVFSNYGKLIHYKTCWIGFIKIEGVRIASLSVQKTADVWGLVEIRVQEGQNSLKYMKSTSRDFTTEQDSDLKMVSSHRIQWGQTTSKKPCLDCNKIEEVRKNAFSERC